MNKNNFIMSTSDYVYDDYSVEYKIVEDEVKKIISITAFKFKYDSYGSNSEWTSQFNDWRKTDEGKWLMARRIEDIKLIKYVSPERYLDMLRVVIKVYEEDAVYHALKWR